MLKTTLIKVIKSPAIIASGISTFFKRENPNELFDKLNLLFQEKRAGNVSDKIDEEIIAIADKLSEFKCMSMK